MKLPADKIRGFTFRIDHTQVRMLHHIDLRSVSIELKTMTMQEISGILTSHKHVLEPDTKIYAVGETASANIARLTPKIQLYHIDAEAQAVWVHISITKLVCRLLNIAYPMNQIITQLRIAQENASRGGGDKAIVQTLKELCLMSVNEKHKATTRQERDKLRILEAVIDMEWHLAEIAADSSSN